MSPHPGPPDDAVPLTPAPADEVGPEVFTPAEYDPLRASTTTTIRRIPGRPFDRSRLRMWLLIGGVLWAIGLAGWFFLFLQGCESGSATGSAAKSRK